MNALHRYLAATVLRPPNSSNKTAVAAAAAAKQNHSSSDSAASADSKPAIATQSSSPQQLDPATVFLSEHELASLTKLDFTSIVGAIANPIMKPLGKVSSSIVLLSDSCLLVTDAASVTLIPTIQLFDFIL